ncbi:hypothetical protein NEAUS03_0058 [Nematocida ausubeli]|nr:hypothetical protein NEAUS03_0058 [Nematocida ausubeli]
MHMRQRLSEVKQLLQSQPHAFYNHPRLLSQIREHGWGYDHEEITRINTERNSRYQYCRILHRMGSKKELFQRKNTSMPPHTSEKVTFESEVKSIEDIPAHPQAHEVAVAKSILKKPQNTAENEVIDQQDIYISHLLYHRSIGKFRLNKKEIFQKKTVYK